MIHDLLMERPLLPWRKIRNQVCNELRELFTKEVISGAMKEDFLKYVSDAEKLVLDHSGMIYYMRLRLRRLKSELPQIGDFHEAVCLLESYLTALDAIVKETESQRKPVIDTPIAVLYASPAYFSKHRILADGQRPYPQSKQEESDD